MSIWAITRGNIHSTAGTFIFLLILLRKWNDGKRDIICAKYNFQRMPKTLSLILLASLCSNPSHYQEKTHRFDYAIFIYPDKSPRQLICCINTCEIRYLCWKRLDFLFTSCLPWLFLWRFFPHVALHIAHLIVSFSFSSHAAHVVYFLVFLTWEWRKNHWRQIHWVTLQFKTEIRGTKKKICVEHKMLVWLQLIDGYTLLIKYIYSLRNVPVVVGVSVRFIWYLWC